MHRTPKQIHADRYLPDGGLDRFVLERRPHTSWQEIATQLRDVTDDRVRITGEGLRVLYVDQLAPAPTP